MIETHLFLQRSQYFVVQILCKSECVLMLSTVLTPSDKLLNF